MTTQNCAECGTPAEPGQSFCDACGAVLRWDQSGARTAQPATASADRAAAPAAAPGRPATAPAPT
ncbi:zinc ribbon domain-containing protein, partial [Streptomyces parvulus]